MRYVVGGGQSPFTTFTSWKVLNSGVGEVETNHYMLAQQLRMHSGPYTPGLSATQLVSMTYILPSDLSSLYLGVSIHSSYLDSMTMCWTHAMREREGGGYDRLFLFFAFYV